MRSKPVRALTLPSTMDIIITVSKVMLAKEFVFTKTLFTPN